MKKKTIVIFGISSFVGSNLAEYLKEEFRVIGTFYNTPVKIPGVLCIPCDVMKREAIQMVLYTFKPQLTIYTVGLTSISYCHELNHLADALNTGGIFNLAQFTERYGSKLCYISSAYIFSGEEKNNLENDTPDPNTFYGKTKSAAEYFIQKSCLNYVIFRCGNFFGRSINPRILNWFELMERKIFKNEVFSLDGKIKIGFLDTYYLYLSIKYAIEEDVTNRLFQLSSKDVTTYFDFAKHYTKIFQKGEHLIKKANWDFPLMDSARVNHEEKEYYHYQLDTKNIESTFSIKIPTVEEAIKGLYEKWKGGGKIKSERQSSEINFI